MNPTPERWQDIARLYELALEQPASARDAFVAAACGGDQALRREVESLLRQDTAGLVLDRSIWPTAASLLQAGSDLGPGTTLGPYRIESPLGAGGMAEVFRGSDTRLNRPVAIKVLPTGLALDPGMRARFAREARAVAALTHPNICTLYDVGRHEDIDFLVMEYLPGETLAARLTRGRLSTEEALTCAVEIASALDHAHRHGIVHRDLKPANIMLAASGAKLLDFGVAKFRPPARLHPDDAGHTRPRPPRGPLAPLSAGENEADDGSLTGDGAVLGTIRYMAPEQIQGRSADARSDLFSFAAVVFEMLTGTRAFEGDTLSSIRTAVLEHHPPAMSSLHPSLPAALDDLVHRCLAKNPEERPQTAGVVLQELRQVLQSLTRRDVPARRALDWHRRWRGVAGALVLAVVTGLAVWGASSRSPEPSAAPAAAAIRSVAVLPLLNLSSEPEQEYFAEGMTDHLIAQLARIRGLRVIPSSSTMHYRTSPKPVPTVARELQVEAVVEGSVARAGETVRVTARLVSGATGEIVWTESFERDARDVLALQSDVARAISNTLDVSLTSDEQARLANARPVDPVAHRQLLLGRHYAAKGTEEGLRKAVRYFHAAIEKDPANAAAYASLADAHTELAGFYVDPREAMPKAKQAAEAAIRLDDTVAQAHAALGYVQFVFDWNGPAAATSLRRALALDPTLAKARLNYAGYLATQVRHDEAAQEIRRAVDLDPRSIRTHAFGTFLLLFLRRYDEAIVLAEQGLEFEPDSAFPLAFQGMGYAELGRFKEAVDRLERAVRLDDSLTIRAIQAHVLAVAGRKEEARVVIRSVQEAAKHRYFCPYEIATAYVSLGDSNTAFRFFRKGTDEHADCMPWLGVEPWLDRFRSDPRYTTLVREIGLDPRAQ